MKINETPTTNTIPSNMKIEVKIDLSMLDDGEIQALKTMAVKSQTYDKAAIIRDFQKHCEAINKLSENKCTD